MLIIGSILLLLANACTLSSENILFNRVAILILLPALFIGDVQNCLFHFLEFIAGFVFHLGLQESDSSLLLGSTFLAVAKLPTDLPHKSLTSYFITGFTDAEGSF